MKLTSEGREHLGEVVLPAVGAGGRAVRGVKTRYFLEVMSD